MKKFNKYILIILILLISLGTIFAENSDWEQLFAKARTYYRQEQYTEGIIAAEKSLEIAKTDFGKEHPNVAKSLKFLGYG